MISKSGAANRPFGSHAPASCHSRQALSEGSTSAGSGRLFDRQMTGLAVIWAKTLSYFGHISPCQIDFGHFDPMFPLNAALDRNAIPWFAARQRKTEPPASLERAVSGLNATAFLPSIPNGGVD